MKMTFRIFIKALRLALRTGKRFLLFVTIYAVLIGWTAITLDGILYAGGEIWPAFIFIGIVAVVALVYGLLISSYRKTQILIGQKSS